MRCLDILKRDYFFLPGMRKDGVTRDRSIVERLELKRVDIQEMHDGAILVSCPCVTEYSNEGEIMVSSYYSSRT